MKQKLINIYNVDDLEKPENNKIKKRVMDKHYYINVDNTNWYDWIEEDLKRELKASGFWDIEFEFSGFSSQGDGANIIGSIDFNDACNLLNVKNIYKDCCEFDYIQIVRNYSRYAHEGCLDVNNVGWSFNNPEDSEQFDESEKIEEKIDDFVEYVCNRTLSFMKERSRQLYNSLDTEYDFLTKEESIYDTMRINDYWFDEAGNIVYPFNDEFPLTWIDETEKLEA
jgi:hypothetical protein